MSSFLVSKFVKLQIYNLFHEIHISRSAHQTPNLTNPQFQFPQFKVLQSGSSFRYNELYWHFWVYFDINLKLLSGKNTQKVNKQNIRDS